MVLNLKQSWAKLKNILSISFSLAKADFSLRIEGSYLGIFWYLLNPLVTFLVIILIKKYALASEEIKNYPIYLFMGITSLNFFRQVLSNSIKSIRSNIDYLKSINDIAPEALVVSGVMQSIFSHFFEFILIIGFMVYYKLSLVGLFFYPLVFTFFILSVLGISLIFATIGMYVNDFNNIWSVVADLLLFITPVFYILKTNSYIYFINLFNPLFYFISISRSAVINLAMPPFWMTMIFFVSSIGSLAIGITVFNKFKRNFAQL